MAVRAFFVERGLISWIPACAGMTNGSYCRVIGSSTIFVIPPQAGMQLMDPPMRDTFDPCTYLLASHRSGTLYVGVTSNLLQRLHQHREGLIAGFTHAYGVTRLVWFEQHATMEHAIMREKRIKKWNRAWKIALIEAGNPDWRDLAVEFGFAPARSSRVVR